MTDATEPQEPLPSPPPPGDIAPVTIEEEMRRSYLDYAMSVIVSRALPDARDGLKPVQRRILYAMKEGGYDSTKPFRKSARIVGDVMGKYHPHGDQPIYDAMVRMAQDFSVRVPLIDGQGNFGSMDGDPPAAMRYTEARLARVAETMLDDIDKDTVDFQPNYDDQDREPTVLPARFPNLLANGVGGIAVGMATNIPPHNLGELIDACCALIDDPVVSAQRLQEIVPGPDFPTGGTILGRNGIRSAYELGRGSIVMQARTHMEELRGGREAIVVTEVPFQENKAKLVERIAEVMREKRVEGISELRDESDRDGVRIVIELRREAMSDVVLKQLFRFTPLRSTFPVNALALDGGRPRVMTLRELLQAFIRFREDVITRRTRFLLDAARNRAHILVGLAIAVANIDEVIETIRRSPDPATARERLMARDWPAQDVQVLIELIDEPGRGVSPEGTYRLSEAQARAILDLRLHRLTGLERDKIAEELQAVADEIRNFLELLASREKLYALMRSELVEIKERFATPRRTEILDDELETDIEELIQREDMVVTVTHGGYVKRVPVAAYRAQRRGGKGRAGMATRDDDFVSTVFVANTHTPVLFFTSRGIVHKLKVWRLPLGAPQARGKAFVNLLPLQEGEAISTVMPMPEDEATWSSLRVMFATARGGVRRNELSDFVSVNQGGKIAMKFEGADEGDRLIAAQVCTDEQDVLLATRLGKAIRFPVSAVRVFASRNSTGVRGIALAEGDEVISMTLLESGRAATEERDAYLRQARLLRQLENGNGESEAAEEANGAANGAAEEGESAQLILAPDRFTELAAREDFVLTVASTGFGKRTSAYEYRVTGRGGKGVDLMNLAGGATVAAAFPVAARDQIMVMTDGGTLIRCPVEGIRIAGRNTRGVRIVSVADGEKVVSVAHLVDDAEADEATGK
ncbi:DNA gyrase subunit A [Vineibacter terrae]|uniref:DNA gyrase subunit A n=1 Tax=Vineibacter terrae TaxID=2586908 RepID=UPI002E2F4407|nr:DNA gyrase subunit A [Vineibacter terrae]HEX2885093.1 DNA gyrase subunit A [Vineibacter terrae]